MLSFQGILLHKTLSLVTYFLIVEYKRMFDSLSIVKRCRNTCRYVAFINCAARIINLLYILDAIVLLRRVEHSGCVYM